MTLDEITSFITVEGEIEIRVWDDVINDALVLFKGDAWELDMNASYMFEEISNMFSYNDGHGSALCFELVDCH